MPEETFCKNCTDNNRCESVYRKMNNNSSQSVLPGVVIAFLIPMIVFIALIWFFGQLAGIITDSDFTATTFSFFASLVLTLLTVMLLKKLCRAG